MVKHVRDCLMSLSQSARQFNDNLEREIATLLAARKKRLLANAGMVDAIGLPIKKRSGVPVAYAVPVTRRAPKIEHIRVQGSFKPEPTLAKADYEDILGIMKNMARVMELSPHAFVDMGKRRCVRISWSSSTGRMRGTRPARRSISKVRPIS